MIIFKLIVELMQVPTLIGQSMDRSLNAITKISKVPLF